MIRTQLTVALILLGWTGASVHGQIDTITVTHPINVALDGTATASGATWAGWDPNFIIDGDIGSINHASEPVEQFGYTIELPSVVAFDQINVVGRNSDCCVNRLTNYRVAILDDAAGMPGAVLWSADVRTDGSNSGPGGVDELLADRDPAGTFAGRWVSVSKIPNPAEVDYYLQIAEVELLSGTATETIPINYAAGASVTPSGPTWDNWDGVRIVDGNTSTVNHAAEPVTEFGYLIEMPQEVDIDHINIVNRVDGCCPERLTNYRVSILDADGVTPIWSTDVRTDGTNSGVAGVDVINEAMGAGSFSGRFISIDKIPDASQSDYYLQIAEVEVFGHAVPEPAGWWLIMSGLVCGLRRRR